MAGPGGRPVRPVGGGPRLRQSSRTAGRPCTGRRTAVRGPRGPGTVDVGGGRYAAEPQFLGLDRSALVFQPTRASPRERKRGPAGSWSAAVRGAAIRRSRARSLSVAATALSPTVTRTPGTLHGATELVALDGRTGEQRWTSLERLPAPKVSGRLKEICFADRAGRFLALDQRTGRRHWSADEVSPASVTRALRAAPSTRRPFRPARVLGAHGDAGAAVGALVRRDVAVAAASGAA